jgi:6-phosphogluconate dehydrogenase
LVKLVHNAIEHSDMQLIAETHNILSNVFHLAPADGRPSSTAGAGPLRPYSIEIAAMVLARKDVAMPLVDLILNRAARRAWQVDRAGLIRPDSHGVRRCGPRAPSPTPRTSALPHRSSLQRTASRGSTITIGNLENALDAAKITCSAQGLALIQRASSGFGTASTSQRA